MKRKVKISVSLIVSLVILFNTFIVVYAGAPNDVDKSSSYARDSINYLFSKKIISGDGKGNFNPKASVTRGEAVKIIINAKGIDTTNIPDKPTFKDVPKSHWAYKYVETAYKMGITKGLTDDVFGVNEFCTREQISTFYIRTLGLSQKELSDVQINGLVMEYTDYNKMSSWSKPYIEFMTITGLMKGNEYREFLPKVETSKEQLAVITDRFINSTNKLNTYIDLYRIANNVQISKRNSTVYLATEKPIRAFGVEEIIDESGKSQFSNGRMTYLDDKSIVSYYDTNLKADKDYSMVMYLQYNTAYGVVQFRMRKDVTTDKLNTGVLSVVPIDQTQIKLYYPYANLDESYKQVSNYVITDSNNNALSVKAIEKKSSNIVITLEKAVEIGSKLKIQVEGLKVGPAAGDIKFAKFIKEFTMGSKPFEGVSFENNSTAQINEIQSWAKGPINIFFNGDQIGIADSSDIQNNELLVPESVFKHLGFEIFGDKAEGYDLETKGATYTVKIGEKMAFKNIGMYFKPFDNVDKYKDNIVQLNAAPVYNEKLLLPFGVILNTKEVNLYADEKSRALNIRMDTFNYPILRLALGQPPAINRQVSVSIETAERDGNDDTLLKYDNVQIESTIVNKDVSLIQKSITQKNVESKIEQTKEIVYKDGKAYENILGEKWGIVDKGSSEALKALINTGLSYDDFRSYYGSYLHSTLIKGYKDISIKRAGQVSMNGKNTTQYTFELNDQEGYFTMYPIVLEYLKFSDKFNILKTFPPIKYTIKIWIDDRGSIVAEQIETYSKLENTEAFEYKNQKLVVTGKIHIDYKYLSEDTVIKAPIIENK